MFAVTSSGGANAACQLQQLAEFNVTMDGNEPLVDATIDGHPVKMLVDLGGWITMLSRPGATSLGLAEHSLPGTAVELYGVGGKANARYAQLQDFKVGDIDQPGVRLVVASDRRFSGLAVGLIGRDILSLGDIDFDFAHGKMRLFKPKDCKGDEVVYWADGYFMAPIWNALDRSPIEIPVSLNGYSILAEMDTGSDVTVVTTASANQARVTPHSERVTPAGLDYGIGPAAVATSIGDFATFSIGNETVKNAKLKIGDFFDKDRTMHTGSLIPEKIEGLPDMLLGADFFRAHHVYVARSQGRIYFTYNGGPIFQIVGPAMAGELDQVIQRYDQAILLNPNDAESYAARGEAHAQKGALDLAIEDYDQAIRLQPGAGEFYDSRGLIRIRKGDFNGAIGDYDAALKIAPRSAVSLFGRGLARRRKGDLAGGDADLAAAKAIDQAIASSFGRMGLNP